MQISFTWGRRRDSNPTKQPRRVPNARDMTDSLTVNHELTYGLYHNQASGFKLAGALAFNPIAVPVWFMGLPVPESDDDATQELLTEVTDQFSTIMQQMHIECHRDGTLWIWPFFSSVDGKLHWEIIPDGSITAIVRSIETGNVIKIISEEQLTVTVDDRTTAIVGRKRVFTRELVTETWIGQNIPGALKGGTKRNVSGELPIPFANNADATEVRGHSDYERIIYDLKDYHDIDLMQSTTLAKFNAKLIITMKNAKEWLANNGFGSIADVDVAGSDMFLNTADEKAEMLFPTNAHEAYESALKRKFRKIVEGSGIPEICWGVKVEGNLASAEEQMGLLVQFVKDKRSQKVDSYKRLFAASVKLLGTSRMQVASDDIEVTWGALDELSAKTKAEVFKAFADGIGVLVNSAGMTKGQMYRLWDSLYPAITTEDEQGFIEELSGMAKHKQFKDADFDMARDEF